MRSALASGLPPQAFHHLGHFERGVKTGQARPLDHARRQVDADDLVDLRGEGAGRQPGAAAEIDGAPEERRLADRGARRTAPP